MDLLTQAQTLLAPLGYEVLELSISGKGHKRRVLLRIDRLDRQPVTVDDVTEATRVFGLELDRLDPFDTPYSLEIESPGPERPLLTREHFERFHGLLAKVRVSGETFLGRISAVDDNNVTLTLEQSKEPATRCVALQQIQSARLAEWPSEPR